MKLKIGTKLMGGFGAVLFFTLIIGVIAYTSILKVVHLNEQVTEMDELRRFLVEKEVDHLSWVEQLADTILTGKEFKAQRNWHLCGIGKWYYDFIKTDEYKNADPKLKHLLDSFEEPHINLHKSANLVTTAIDKHDKDHATHLYSTQAQSILHELRSIFHNIANHYKQAGESLMSHSKSTVKSTIVMVLVFIALAVIIGVVISTVISRGVTNPINNIVGMLKDVAEGDGDLTKRIAVSTKDETKDLAAWFNKFIGNVENDMIQIRDVVEQIAAASEEISTNAQNVSQGAQNQSSTIEEITASVEELTSSISDVSKNSQDTNSLAQEASNQAVDGGKSVEESIGGMKEISKSSTQIADIIGTISDIADQTNLLALNAAIEAARAGEHGMGFAVVADEVRKLAERTQDAAKEITALIRESTKNVEDGNKLSEAAGEALTKIVESIRNTSERISQISAATEEQSATAGEVSKAVENVSKITEENAGSSEEMASSAEELAGQGESLRQIVNKFKLSDKLASNNSTDTSV
jgi:methyl-accepting chemotaxis protein